MQTAQAFKEGLVEFQNSLANSPSNSFVPSQRKIIDTIGGATLVGLGLSQTIDRILSENQVTPASALSAVQELRKKVSQFHKSIVGLTGQFKELGVGSEDLTEGAAEVGILLPRDLVGNDLSGLSKEIREFEKHLRTIVEVAEGDGASPKIRSIGTGSLEFFLESSPATAAMLMIAVERIAAFYKQVLEIRLLRKQLEEKDVPAATTKPVKVYESEMVSQFIEKLTTDLLKQFYGGKDTGRKNELRVALKNALQFLGDRIDRGVDIEARPPKQEADVVDVGDGSSEGAKESGNGAKQKEHLKILAEKGAVLLSLERSGEPVLQITDGQKDKADSKS